MKDNKVEKDFIEEWGTYYDAHEHDELKYQSIIQQIKHENLSGNFMSKNTFNQIIEWKSPRLKGIVKLDQYEDYYKPVIQKITDDNDLKMKLNLLIVLYGINIPTATTILHFIYPNVYPIMDFRTIESLIYFGILKSKGKSLKNY